MFFGGIDFVFAAIGVSMVIRAINGGGRRHRYEQPSQPARLEDPRVAQLQAEVEELRTQVERLSAAESFYAQLNAPAPPSSAAGQPSPSTPNSVAGG